MPDYDVRPATPPDLPALGRLGALLVRTHHDFDRERFLAPGIDPERGYAAFLSAQLGRQDSAIFVADRSGTILGYVYTALEPHSWKDLREAAGYVHDLAVDESARRAGIATALMQAAIGWLRASGAPRVVLGTAYQNERARRLFEALGFRPTMVEMTKEL